MEQRTRPAPRPEDLEKLAASQQEIMKVLHDSFGEDPEVFEVALYALSTLGVNNEIQRAMMAKATAVVGIPPESLHIMKRFDSGLAQNTFFTECYAAIKMDLVNDDIELETLREFIIQGEKTGDKRFFEHAKATMFNRYRVLTTIAFFYQGVTFAEEFNKKVRLAVDLGPDFTNYFASKGV